ncbi:MAG: hypothetical protein AAB367_03880 [Patescibacteria group bacterium]
MDRMNRINRATTRYSKGIIQLGIIIILSVVILSLLGVSLSSLVNNKTIKENFIFLWEGITWVWQNYAGAWFWKLWDLVSSFWK